VNLDDYSFDARMKLHAKSFFFRSIRAFFRTAARLDSGSRILDQRIAALYLLIKRIEYLDPVSRIQYLASVRVAHHRFELSTKSCSKRNEILTPALTHQQEE
jgi:hypothetical protein